MDLFQPMGILGLIGFELGSFLGFAVRGSLFVVLRIKGLTALRRGWKLGLFCEKRIFVETVFFLPRINTNV